MNWTNKTGSWLAWTEALGLKELCVEADGDGFILLLIGPGEDEFLGAFATVDAAKAAGEAYAVARGES